MKFGDFLRERREQINITQAELARRLSQKGHATSHTRVSHWESGRNKPPIEISSFRDALALSLEMSANDMMSELGYIVTNEELSQAARLAAEIVEHLPPDAQDLAVDYLRVLEKRFLSNVG